MAKLKTDANAMDLFIQTEDTITDMGWEHEGHGGMYGNGLPFNRDASWRLAGADGNYLHLSLYCEARNEAEDKRKEERDKAMAARLPRDLSAIDPNELDYDEFASVLVMCGTRAMFEEWKRLRREPTATTAVGSVCE